MKKNYPTIKLLLFVLLFPITVTSLAQSTVGDGLNGETIIATDNFETGHLSDINVNLSATNGGVYVSFFQPDGLGGETFNHLWSPPPGTKIKDMAVKKYRVTVNGRVDYYKTDNAVLVLLDNGNVYKLNIDYEALEGPIVDSLKIWGNLGAGFSEAVQKLDGDALYALSSSHLYISTDSSTWHVDSAGLTGAHINSMSLDTLQRLYVATGNGLFTQDTSAITPFAKITGYTGPQNLSAVFADRRNRLYVAANGGGIYYSINNGTTWQIDTTGIGNNTVSSFSDDVYGNVYCIVAGAKGNRLYKLPGGNQSWQLTDSSIYNKTVNPVVILSVKGDSILTACTSFGIFLSGDAGATWVQNNKGILSENISGIAKTPGGRLLLANALGINKKTGNASWAKTYPANGFTGNLPLYDDGAGTVYTIDNSLANNFSLGGYLLKSTDGGDTWAPDTLGLSSVGGSVFFVDEKGTQHIGNSFYSGSKPSELWQKPKNGSWAIDTAGFPVLSYSFVFGITSDKAGYLYATGSFNNQKIMRRSITGTKWVIDTAGIPGAVSYFNKIMGANGDVIGTTNNALYHRGSGTWSKIALPRQATFPTVSAVAIDTSGYIFVALNAATGAGVYFTSDLGAHWKYAGLDSASVSALQCYGDTTYVLTRNMGVFALTHNSALPVTLSSIKAYQLGKGIQVEWSGYNEINMSGYDVERSANGSLFSKLGNMPAKGNSAGSYAYTWFDGAPVDGDNFYRIKAISKDGTSQYSGIVKVGITSVSDLTVYPNPVGNRIINVQLSNIDAGNYLLAVYNASGQRLYVRNITHPGGNAGIAVDMRNMTKGAYWVVLKSDKHIYRKTVALQ